jgi:3-oxoacyl-[acyl-carrier-protein] synthase II
MAHGPVVLTGIGVLASNGTGRRAFWDALAHGRSGVRRIARFDASDLPCQIAGELVDFNPADFMRKHDVKRWHRHVHQAVAAAKLAAQDADLAAAKYLPERMAVAMGTSAGTPDEYYFMHREAYETRGWKHIDQMASSASTAHAATANVSAELHLRGPSATYASGCATGLDVIHWGVEQIVRGLADAAVVGATEAPLTLLTLAATCSMGILSTRNEEPEKAMRPFDRGGDGIVLSEGAAAVVLEQADKAHARGAPILAEVLGYGTSTEGQNPLLIDRDGAALTRAISSALRAGGIRPEDIDGAVCHGAGLKMYDRAEVAAYKHALGRHAYRIPISATKSMTGQPYAVGGLWSVGAALLTLTQGIVPPTLNLEDPDPECDLDFVPGKARRNDVKVALVTAMSFGGNHSALLLRKVNGWNSA